jgi:hypothetical protein
MLQPGMTTANFAGHLHVYTLCLVGCTVVLCGMLPRITNCVSEQRATAATTLCVNTRGSSNGCYVLPAVHVTDTCYVISPAAAQGLDACCMPAVLHMTLVCVASVDWRFMLPALPGVMRDRGYVTGVETGVMLPVERHGLCSSAEVAVQGPQSCTVTRHLTVLGVAPVCRRNILN